MNVNHVNGGSLNGSSQIADGTPRAHRASDDSVRMLADEVSGVRNELFELRKQLHGRRSTPAQRVSTAALEGAALMAGMTLVSAIAYGIQCAARALIKA